MIGGYNNDDNRLPTEVYSPQKNKWTTLSNPLYEERILKVLLVDKPLNL